MGRHNRVQEQRNRIEKPKQSFTSVPPRYENIVHIYYEKGNHDSGPVRSYRNDTKYFATGIKYLKALTRGTMFNNTPFDKYRDFIFRTDDIEMCVNRHLLALTNKYLPQNKDSLIIHLDRFIYDGFNKINKSWFLHWWENEPELITIQSKNKYPTIRKALIDNYQSCVLLGDFFMPTETEEQIFTVGSSKIFKFFNENQNNFTRHITPISLTRFVCEAVIDEFDGCFDITPALICSKKTFEERLPRYLNKQNLLRNLYVNSEEKQDRQSNRETNLDCDDNECRVFEWGANLPGLDKIKI